MILRLLRSISFILLGIFLALLLGEVAVRIASLNQENYVIEMWRYAKTLKTKSPDPQIGHEHIPLKSATLQNIAIKINSFGMRGPEPDNSADHRIAIIGDSLAFGWGVPEQDSLRGQLAQKMPDTYDVVNSGIGNMNILQAVHLWMKYQKRLPADIIIVLATSRATTQIATESPGWFIENSQLAALTSTVIQQLSSGQLGKDKLVRGYRQQWTSESGQKTLDNAFSQLKQLADTNNAHVIIVSIPETHDFNNYHFGFMQTITQEKAEAYDLTYINPLPLLQGPPTSSFWVSKNDIHLNQAGFDIISDEIKKVILNELLER